MIKAKVVLLLSALALASPVRAAEFYVAPDGKSTNTGTISSPWDLQTALNHPATLKPGDTVWLRNGIHRMDNRITKFTSRLAGTSTAPITVRQYPGERATIDGNILQSTGGWVNYWGFEIYNSNTNRYTSQTGPWPTTWWVKYDGKDVDLCVSGFDLQAPNVKLINLVVRDSIGGGFGISKTAQNTEMYGCLSYYNGWLAPDRAHGHGLYGQNAAPYTKNIMENLFYGNLALGLQATGNGPEPIADNFNLEGNALFQNGILATKHQANILVGAWQGRAQNPRIIGNMVYDTMGSGSDSYIGYSGGTDNAVVQNNYFGTSAMFSTANFNMTVSGNLFGGGIINLDKTKYPNNTFLSAKPTQNAIFVRPNKYEAGRGNIVIYNWQKLNTISVDPSAAGLKSGDVYELRNAQNFYGDVITGTYNGGSISIPMTGRTVAKPQGANFTTPASTFPEFGVFVIMKKAGSAPPPVNTAPVVSSIANQTIQEDSATAPISFTVSDAETAAANLSVTASSSNQTLVPNANIALGGSGGNRTITVTPAKEQSGSATITIFVSDGINVVNRSFALTVTAINRAPQISAIANQTIKENTSAGPIGFTVSDRETSAANLSVTGTSSNTTLVPNGNIVFGGSGSNRTITVTPAANQFGTATITVRVSDGVNITSQSFALIVEAVNSAPVISSIGNQSIPEDGTTSAIGFTVSDRETAAANLAVTASSANQTLVPNANITLGGSGSNRTITVKPAADQFGTVAITVAVSDGALTATTSFTLVVTAVNDAPTISSIPDQTTQQDTATGQIPFVIGDIDTPIANLSLAGGSSNPTLVPNANIVFGGSGTNRTVKVTPASGQSGSAVITVSVNDGAASASKSFNLTVDKIDDGGTNTTDNVYLGIEAEDAVIVSPMTVVTDTKVPSRRYVHTPLANQGTATYTVEVPKTGTYIIWSKILGETFASDSFFVAVNGEEDVFDAAENKTSPEWQWSIVNGRGGTGTPLKLAPRTFNLSQGLNTILIRGREANAGLDRFIITDDLNYTPTELMATDDVVAAYAGTTTQIGHTDLLQNDNSLFEDKLTIIAVSPAANGTVVLTSSTISYTPKAGFSGIDNFSYTVKNDTGATSTANVTVEVKSADRIHLGFEAESGTLVSPMVLETDNLVPDRKYIWSTKQNKGTATYTIDIPRTDTYVIWAKILGIKFNSDSFFVSVDGDNDIFDAAEGKESPNWQWSVVNGRGSSGKVLALNPRTFTLAAGKHTIVVGGRESKAGLDRIIITNDRDYVPQEVIAVADQITASAGSVKKIAAQDLLLNDISLFQNILTITAVKSGATGTATLSGSTVSYAPKAGFTGTDTFTYTISDGQGSTSTGTVTVTVQ
ncbi:MAG: tandem-95 repeat protein [Verrucomicrobia bacterium]|nr:tandem-95 repeat protein [Verrucomicrobiota bacterium]